MPPPQKEVMLARARQQRRNNVTAEANVWRILRSRALAGYKFRRQVPIENYILDFVCFGERCVIEVDGPSHEAPEKQARDAVRDAWLRANGFRVLRVSNDLAIGDPAMAEKAILDFVRANPSSVRLCLTPSPAGEKGANDVSWCNVDRV